MSVMISLPLGLSLVPGHLIIRAVAWSWLLMAPRANTGSRGNMVLILRVHVCVILLPVFAEKMLWLSSRREGKTTWAEMDFPCTWGASFVVKETDPGKWMKGRSSGASISTCCFFWPSWSPWWLEEVHPIFMHQETGSKSYVLGYTVTIAGAGISTPSLSDFKVYAHSATPYCLSLIHDLWKRGHTMGQVFFPCHQAPDRLFRVPPIASNQEAAWCEKWWCGHWSLASSVWPLVCHLSASDLGQVINSLSFPYVD